MHLVAQVILVTVLDATSSLALLRLFKLSLLLVSLELFEKFRVALFYELHFLLSTYL